MSNNVWFQDKERTARQLTLAQLTLAQRPNRTIAYLGRPLTWLLSLIIVALSLAPPSLRPVMASHKFEHFAIFVMWGLAFGLSNRINQAYQIVAAIFFAAAIEIAQHWVPGRHARISDFAVDVVAACVGILFARIFTRRLVTWFTRRHSAGCVDKIIDT